MRKQLAAKLTRKIKSPDGNSNWNASKNKEAKDQKMKLLLEVIVLLIEVRNEEGEVLDKAEEG